MLTRLLHLPSRTLLIGHFECDDAKRVYWVKKGVSGYPFHEVKEVQGALLGQRIVPLGRRQPR